MRRYITRSGSVYETEGNKVTLIAGTPSGHLKFGVQTEVAEVNAPEVGEHLVIRYRDGMVRTSSMIERTEENVEAVS